jgi:hypothetical protein
VNTHLADDSIQRPDFNSQVNLCGTSPLVTLLTGAFLETQASPAYKIHQASRSPQSLLPINSNTFLYIVEHPPDNTTLYNTSTLFPTLQALQSCNWCKSNYCLILISCLHRHWLSSTIQHFFTPETKWSFDFVVLQQNQLPKVMHFLKRTRTSPKC